MPKNLLNQVGQYKTPAILTPIFTALEVVMDVLIPYIIASLIDKGISAGNMQNVYKYGLLMFSMALLSLLFGILAGRFSAIASTGFGANLRSAMYRNIQTFSFADIDKISTSGLVTRMTTDVSNLQSAFQNILRISVRAPFRLILSIVMCLVIDRRLSLIFVIALIILSISLYLIISNVSRLFAQVFKQYDKLNGIVQENVSGMRVVKAFVREDYERKKFNRVSEGLHKLFVKTEKIMAFNHPVMNMVVYFCIIALSWYGAHFIVDGTLTTGQLTSLFTYVMSILMSLMMLSMIIVKLTQSAASWQRVSEVINMKSEITNPKNPVLEVKNGSVDFSHVSFAYPGGSGEYALNDLDFHIGSGEIIGLIGGTGSGKSSVINLISRLYDANKGTVSVGGVDVRDYDLETLRNHVAVVLQKNVLFSGTILENLRWGKQDATLEECRRVCRVAAADDFIENMPEKYDTMLEQGGANLSGGQKQRICIARALLKDPKVIVLDDSTSACDNHTDAKIRNALISELQHVTKIIISQRISSIKECDRIMVLENGKISAFDTHENLLENSALYQEICNLQEQDSGDFDELK